MRSVPVELGLREAVRAGRRLYRAKPWVLDTIIAAAMIGAAAIWLHQYPYAPDGRHVYSAEDVHHVPFRPLDVAGYALTVACGSAVAVRRWRADAVLVATCALIAVYTALDYPPTTLAWCPPLIFYTLCTRTVPPRAAPFALALFTVWLQYSLKLQVPGVLSAVVQSVLVVAVTWVFGDQTRRLGERGRRLASLTAQLRREQAARAGRAVATERVRIARELHDVVAHHMSVVSVQVGLARYVLASDAATAGQAMDTIAEATHEAMLEMRRMLAVLRPVSEDGPRGRGRAPSVEPALGLSRLDGLLDRVRAGGVEVELRVDGEAVALPPGPDLCCYRVAQESLTNVMKHAAGARTVVELTYQRQTVTLRVADDGVRVRSLMNARDGGPASPGLERTGNGLVGMRERARIYGGTLTAGHRATGGFEVVLKLPVGDAADDSQA